MVFERDIWTMRFKKGNRISYLGARDEKVDNTILRSTVSQSIGADLQWICSMTVTVAIALCCCPYVGRSVFGEQSRLKSRSYLTYPGQFN